MRANFKDLDSRDHFLFVACDGYRCLFSFREIFALDSGRSVMIADKINGRWPPAGFRLAPTADYFADRSMWAVAYVVRIRTET